MSEAKTALDLAKEWKAERDYVKTLDRGAVLNAIHADSPEQIERLTRRVKDADAAWQSAESRIAHICQLLGVDFTCEEPETCEQVIKRMTRENAELHERHRKDQSVLQCVSVTNASIKQSREQEEKIEQLEARVKSLADEAEEAETHAAYHDMRREINELKGRLGTIHRSAEAQGITLGNVPDYGVCESFARKRQVEDERDQERREQPREPPEGLPPPPGPPPPPQEAT